MELMVRGEGLRINLIIELKPNTFDYLPKVSAKTGLATIENMYKKGKKIRKI
jgi:hypothetical protein